MEEIEQKLQEYKDSHNGKDFMCDVSTKTIEDICQLLQCQPEDLIELMRKFFTKCMKEHIQIATAIVKKCDMFFTNDKQLRQEKELPCMTMEDI